MKFLTHLSDKNKFFSLVYREEDHSFDVEPLLESGETSIMINDLQLEIDHQGNLMYVWGYCPLNTYQNTEIFPNAYQTTSLVAMLDKPIISGISYRLNEENRWPIFINRQRGWVCIGHTKTNNQQLIEFAPNCIAVLEDLTMTAIWLKPQHLPYTTNLN